MFMSTGQALEHRPQPVHPASPSFSGMYENLCRMRCRHLAACVGRGLWPDVCCVNIENPQESQHLIRLPLAPWASSCMSKHVHTGHTKAHAPQPRHRSD